MSGFIKLNLEISHRDEEEDDPMLGRKKDIRLARINTGQISSFRPSKDKKSTEVFLSGGEEYVLGISADKFEELMEEHESIDSFNININ